MTLAAVWIERHPGGSENLCFASDSRTSPGPIEGVTKVVLFGRSDLVGVWAGDFRYAALITSHLDAALTTTESVREQHVDVARLLDSVASRVREHLRRTLSAAVRSFEVNRAAQEPEITDVVVGGYSIDASTFTILRIRWDPQITSWTTSVVPIDPAFPVYLGDWRAKARNQAKAIRRYRSEGAKDWRMEPLAAIDHFRHRADRPTIGGDIQLAKAFRRGNARAFGIASPEVEGVSIRGSRFGASVLKELRNRDLLVDMAQWSLAGGVYGPAKVR